MFRVEDKYVIPQNDYFELRERLAAVLSRDSNSSSASNVYQISSLYFDDLKDSDYRDTLDGNPHRKKHRIRIYNNSFSTIKLEVKTKQYNRIAKQSVPISEEEMKSLIYGRTISWGDTRDNPRSVFNEMILSRGLRPKVIVTYEREAFLYDSGNTRITFDSAVRASNLTELFGDPELIHDIVPRGSYVLEVKYDEFIPDFVLQLLEIDSMEQTAYSKYQLCREIYM